MVINIPINFDETAFEGKVSEDIQNRVVAELTKRIDDAIARRSSGYYYGDSGKQVIDGIIAMAKDEVSKVINQYEQQIIEIAGNELAARLARTKKGKEILERYEDESWENIHI